MGRTARCPECSTLIGIHDVEPGQYECNCCHKVVEIDPPVPVGKILLLSEGEYSDYNVIMVVRTLKSFSIHQLTLEYRNTRPKSEREPYNEQEGGFMNWMVSSGYVETVEWWEFHVGAYGKLDPDEQWTRNHST